MPLRVVVRVRSLDRANGISYSVGLGLALSKLAIEARCGVIGFDPRMPVGTASWYEQPV